MGNTEQSGLEASIGFSRKWDAREAGREVARSALKKLKTPPSFFLLFSTIQYKKNGGFKKILKGVWDVLPKGTPLIGGTVSSFINNYGCFSRGVTALAISYPNLDVTAGFGRYTKTAPSIAAKKCAKMITEGLKNSKYKNKFLINLISGPTIPDLPVVGRFNVNVKSNVMGGILSNFGIQFFEFIGHGVGKEEDVLNCVAELLPDYCMIGDSSGERLYNYQFFGDKVITNSIVAIGCCIDMPFNIDGSVISHDTGKKFTVTGTAFGDRIITSIDNKPAKKIFFDMLNVDEKTIGGFDDFYYKTSVYFPMNFEGKDENTLGVCGLFGNRLVLHQKIADKNVKLLSVTGHEIIKNIDTLIQNSDQFSPFTLIFYSSLYSYILHDKTHDIKKKLDAYYGDMPFLAIGSLVEHIRLKSHKPSVRVYSFNMFQLGINDFINIIKDKDVRKTI